MENYYPYDDVGQIARNARIIEERRQLENAGNQQFSTPQRSSGGDPVESLEERARRRTAERARQAEQARIQHQKRTQIWREGRARLQPT